VFFIGEILEALEGIVQRFIGIKTNAEFFQPGTECGAAGMLAEHHPVGVPANILGAHDFVGFPVLEHAILMNAGFVGESIGADDGLVRLHRKSGDGRHQP